jgi:tRNA dimethylallyltransferase
LGDNGLPSVFVIYGPTAVGKTSVAIELAERIDGEIVSCDSRQVFKHLDIGTAKPTAVERRRVPFHLIDVILPVRFMSAFEFRELAEAAIRNIESREKTPIMTVGTGFYLKAMTHGIFEAPTDSGIRNRLQLDMETEGPSEMHKRLSAVDPETAACLSENDAVRIVRALELYELTGLTRSQMTAELQLASSRFDFRFAGLELERSLLYEGINDRCIRMLDNGLIDEASGLRNSGVLGDEIASKIVGYAEAYEHLDGKLAYDAMLEKFQQSTRNYAKRQLTWFRKHPGGKRFQVRDNCLIDKILSYFGR